MEARPAYACHRPAPLPARYATEGDDQPMAKQVDEELEKELQDPVLQQDTKAFDFGCAGCMVILLLIFVAIFVFILLSPGRGHYRWFH